MALCSHFQLSQSSIPGRMESVLYFIKITGYYKLLIESIFLLCTPTSSTLFDAWQQCRLMLLCSTSRREKLYNIVLFIPPPLLCSVLVQYLCSSSTGGGPRAPSFQPSTRAATAEIRGGGWCYWRDYGDWAECGGY